MGEQNKPDEQKKTIDKRDDAAAHEKQNKGIGKEDSTDSEMIVQKLSSEIQEIVHSEVMMSILHGETFNDPEFLKQQDNHQYEIALKGIEAERADRRESREHSMAKFKIIAMLGGGVIAALAVLSVIAMFNDNTAFIIELIKAIGFVAGGFGGGILYSRSKEKSSH
jgi:hypothetical protein